ncbi:MAG: DUF4159 domain-containing protein [Acidobacteria bacterium]|nr:DUF4159 domain-containing protein [Acidobacteriota bacterium]
MGLWNGVRRRAWSLALLAVAGAGLVWAQRTYRGIELPPDFDIPEPEDGAKPAEFVFARLVYSDLYAGQELSERPWHIDSPAAERHFLQGLRRLSNIDARSKEQYVSPADEDFFDYPWLYAVEPGHWDLTAEEVEKLREYLLRGGMLVLDDFHGTVEWENFLRGMRQIFPERPVVEVPPDDEVFHVLYDVEAREQIPGVQMLYTGQTWEQDGKDPHWRGVYDDDGRLMVLINWNMDLGDAWEHADWPEYPERYTAMAYRMAINYVIYAMTH